MKSKWREMRVKYRPEKNKEWVEFDPAKEIICPNCTMIKDIPKGWVTHQSIEICPKCKTAMFDVFSLFGDDMRDAALRISLGHLDQSNVEEWYQNHVLWHTMYIVGGAPEWKVEPFNMERRKA